MSDAWLGFLGGVLAALVAGLIASIVQRHNETVKHEMEARLAIYFMLMELSQHYFWVASAELRGEEPSERALARCKEVAWKLADQLRTLDTVENLEEILMVLFSASIESANERAKRLDALIEHYGKLVNPSYSRIIGRISHENILRVGGQGKLNNNAPGLWRL